METRSLTLSEVENLPPIPSGFETDRVYYLKRTVTTSGVIWELAEQRLRAAFRKRYDSGRAEEWLRLYADAGPVDALRFFATVDSGQVEGLLTWRPVAWNNTAWLVDIRVRAASRRRGIGSALVQALKDVVAGLELRGISVETQANNYPAIQFYRRHGFAFSGLNDHLYSNTDLERQDIAVFLFWRRENA